jgi:hypothetical protein
MNRYRFCLGGERDVVGVRKERKERKERKQIMRKQI